MDFGVDVCLVVVAFGDEAGGVLGAQVDFEEPVVLVSACRSGDDLQVGFEPCQAATWSRPAAPAGGLSAYQGEISAGVVDGALDVTRASVMARVWAKKAWEGSAWR